MDGVGSINWWGFSPAIDFQSYLSSNVAAKVEVDEFSGTGAIHAAGSGGR